MKLETFALHHGYESEATTKAAAVPIYQTTAYIIRPPQTLPAADNIVQSG